MAAPRKAACFDCGGVIAAGPEALAALAGAGPDSPQFDWRGGALVKVVRVYDGDTVTVALPLRAAGGVSVATLRVRLAGLDAPEVRDMNPAVKRRAYAARDRLRALVLGRVVWCDMQGADKYGRVLGALHVKFAAAGGGAAGDPAVVDADAAGIAAGGLASLNEWLLANADVRPYSGGTREPW